MRRFLAALLIVAASCGGGDDTVSAEGVVVDVVGSLTVVERFTIRTGAGEDLTFVPEPGVRFHGEGSLGHLRSHLTTGEPVSVIYEVGADGALRALEVDDT